MTNKKRNDQLIYKLYELKGEEIIIVEKGSKVI